MKYKTFINTVNKEAIRLHQHFTHLNWEIHVLNDARNMSTNEIEKNDIKEKMLEKVDGICEIEKKMSKLQDDVRKYTDLMRSIDSIEDEYGLNER